MLETGLFFTYFLSPSDLLTCRFNANSRKVKFVVSGICPDSDFPVKFTDFQVNKKNTILNILS